MNTAFNANKLPDLEENVLAFWSQDNTFQRSLTRTETCKPWVFYDGPPFANGLPHYGHLLTGYTKDTFNRYKTMQGFHVERQFGWDTHGLPAELEAMKQLGLTEKQDVEKMGVDKFNAAAKTSVLQYVDEWKNYVERQGRWVDFDNGYKTLDLTYMESVLWAFKQLHEKELAYEGYRVLPYCWKDETPLSTHELNMDDDVYREREDMSATVKFTLVGVDAERLGLQNVSMLAWTTTPWTLPMNMALAVNPELVYVQVSYDGEMFLLGADVYRNYFPENAEVLGEFVGAELVGLKYEPLWDYYTDAAKWGTGEAWQVFPADFVNAESGTGVVHLAPAHGEDDQKVCERFGVPAFLSVDSGARYLNSVKDFAGEHVLEATRHVLEAVEAENKLFSTALFAHDYPHCWRCGEPLVYKAVSSWFVSTTKLKDRMLELNQEVNWFPEHVKDGAFHNWLAGTRDWSVSRNRYWGTPVPVWKSDNPEYPRTDVYGSLDAMEKDFGVKVTDLHRPFVDSLVRPNPDDPTGRSVMRRVEDVLDVWFDSGSMPFAQQHYPFENKEKFEATHPADFVVEYMGQTRGWFYVMHVLSTALFDRPAYKNVVAHGIVLGADGQKMSKKKGNYPDVNNVFSKYGSDATRWFLLSSGVLKGTNLVVADASLLAGMRQAMVPLMNLHNFYKMNENVSAVRSAEKSENLLDRYLLSCTQTLVSGMTAALDKYDTAAACQLLSAFMDTLNNWYVRRSRKRFNRKDLDALRTLKSVLGTVYRAAAPLLPFLTETLWKDLMQQESVHLTDYPEADSSAVDTELEQQMETVRELCSEALAVRKRNKVRVRQPLTSVTVFTNMSLDGYENLFKEELNVKAILFAEPQPAQTTRTLTLNFREVGQRLGKEAQTVFRHLREGSWSYVDGTVEVGGTVLFPNEFTVEEGNLQKDSSFSDTGRMKLNLALTDELVAEGFTRDVVRMTQEARKAKGFQPEDTVDVVFQMVDGEQQQLQQHLVLFQQEVKANQVQFRTVNADEDAYLVQAGVFTNKEPVLLLLTKS